MKHLLLFTLLILTPFFAQSQNLFGDTDSFLKKYVDNGLVNYDVINNNTGELNNLVEAIADFPLSKADKNTQLAFYLNTYNILAIKNVINNYPLASPLDIDGFFDKLTHTVAGKDLTLNQIENDIIRPVFNDARIHFALVCVAKGCPKLAADAFTTDNVQQQLEKLTVNAMNDPQFIRVKGNTVLASEIFKWYAVDFGDTKASILKYIDKYNNIDLSGYSLDYYRYDWQLNKQ